MILELGKSVSCFLDLDLDREKGSTTIICSPENCFLNLNFDRKRFHNYNSFTRTKHNATCWLGITTNDKKINFTVDLIPVLPDSPIDTVRCGLSFLACLEIGVHNEITNIKPSGTKYTLSKNWNATSIFSIYLYRRQSSKLTLLSF